MLSFLEMNMLRACCIIRDIEQETSAEVDIRIRMSVIGEDNEGGSDFPSRQLVVTYATSIECTMPKPP